MSLSHFQRHVQPKIRCVRSGQLRLYRPRDLERWLESAVPDEVGERPLGQRRLITLGEVRERFIKGAREGIVLNK